jgi:hypothetical protein
MILLPGSKTGKKTVYLGQAAFEELQRTPRIASNPYVIVGNINGQHLSDMQKPLRLILHDVHVSNHRRIHAAVL